MYGKHNFVNRNKEADRNLKSVDSFYKILNIQNIKKEEPVYMNSISYV